MAKGGSGGGGNFGDNGGGANDFFVRGIGDGGCGDGGDNGGGDVVTSGKREGRQKRNVESLCQHF